jgi:hypothetical protein
MLDKEKNETKHSPHKRVPIDLTSCPRTQRLALDLKLPITADSPPNPPSYLQTATNRTRFQRNTVDLLLQLVPVAVPPLPAPDHQAMPDSALCRWPSLYIYNIVLWATMQGPVEAHQFQPKSIYHHLWPHQLHYIWQESLAWVLADGNTARSLPKKFDRKSSNKTRSSFQRLLEIHILITSKAQPQQSWYRRCTSRLGYRSRPYGARSIPVLNPSWSLATTNACSSKSFDNSQRTDPGLRLSQTVNFYC